MIEPSVAFVPPPRPARPALAWWCDARAGDRPRAFLSTFPAYGPTPLLRLDGLAGALGCGRLYVKNETARLGLSSFKALGGAYAVFCVAQRRAEQALGRAVSFAELTGPELRRIGAALTVCCASDGNHGRSVAAGARLVGAACKVFLHRGVSEERVEHIERLGAEIVRIDGSYDESVAAAAAAVRANGWTLVADIAAPEDEAGAEICGFVMQGYAVIVDEILAESEREGTQFTHVFIQAGVGGLAASLAGHWAALRPQRRPKFVIVEPERAACLLESARAGFPVTLPHAAPTIMAMLECQRPSPLSWPVVHCLADAYVIVSDDEAREAVRRLAWPAGGDPPIEAGESGAAGLAGLMALMRDPAAAEIGLDGASRVLAIATEAPTDRSVWSGTRLRPCAS